MDNENLLQLFQASFRENWDLPALSQYGRGTTMTYADLSRRIAQAHLMFRLFGVKRGDKIAVMGKNTVSWVVSYMATLTYGAIVVPVLAEFNPEDAMHIINHSGSVLLFVSGSVWEHMNFDRMPGLKAALSLDDRSLLGEHPSNRGRARKAIEALPAAFAKVYPEGFRRENVKYPLIDPQTVAEINYTSGTTGFSKGVMLTLDNLAGNTYYGVRSRLHFSGSRCLAFLPLAHAYGAAFDMLTPSGVRVPISPV